jgi:hypothetical protein
MDVMLEERGIDPAVYEADRKRARAKAEFFNRLIERELGWGVGQE